MPVNKTDSLSPYTHKRQKKIEHRGHKELREYFNTNHH